MKKYLLLIMALAAVFSSCDYNDRNFDGLDDKSKVSNVVVYDEYTITDADISTIVKALRANKNAADSATANILNADKMFSEAAPANQLIPLYLKTAYTAADVKSSIKVNYQQKNGRSAVVAALTGTGYVFSNNNYKDVWGSDPFVASLTPSKAPSNYIPAVLDTAVVAEPGNYKNVEYYYSEEEPVTTTVESTFFEETFEGQPNGSNVLIDWDGWIDKDLEGNPTIAWANRIFNDNQYAQVSANGKNKHDVWLITKQIDLTNSVATPKLSFDVTVGYYTDDCLTVLVSEDFDGDEDHILSATWTDVTSSFTLPTTPASGYGTLAAAGEHDLSSFKGSKIYVAFRYDGDNTSTPKKTTTYQVDNVKVSEMVVGSDVAAKSLVYAAYQYTDAEKWAAAPSNVTVLQPADYTSIGYSSGTMTNAQAANLLPRWLKSKFPYASDGTTKVVVYKTSQTAYYADEYSYSLADDKWTVNTFITQETDQFVYSTSGWVFDPTIRETLKAGKADTDGYMMIVNYVKAHQALDNPALINATYGDSEYYYGFSGNYGNVSYRDKDRALDTTYPATASAEEKGAFMDGRTVEGLQIYLSLQHPAAQAVVGGIDQMAEITVLIYSSPTSSLTNENWTYPFQCVGDKEWKYIKRYSIDRGIEETAPAE
jgi:hypothetical protein